jgi:quinohemoprotein ethanol dehydrogenase
MSYCQLFLNRTLQLSVFSCLLVLSISGCHKKAINTAALDKPVVEVAPRPVDVVRLTDADNDRANWLMQGRTYSEQRFSPLEAINVESVQHLRLAWYIDLLPGERGQASTPLVVDGVMYVTTSWSRVIALEASTGKMIWRYDPKVPGEWAINACCDVVNRGVAFWEGKVYLGALDGRLIALNATNGKLLWETVVIDRAERASITGAPRIIKGKVFIGSEGKDFDVRGRMTAVDANTGTILWRIFMVPGDPSTPENQPLSTEPKTWTGKWWSRGGGGTVSDAMAYDSVRDLMYIGTGNASPWPQSIRSPKGGDNLFVSSIIALHPDTGEYVWHYQTTPGDEWGFDATSQLTLAELSINGQLRSVIMQASANGFFYVLDRVTGQLISAAPFVPVNWAKGIDLNSGRPIENPAARYSKTQKPFEIQPGPHGAHSWHPMAFNPRNGLVYIPAMENAATLSVDKTEKSSRYALTRGAVVTPTTETDTSHLSAWDPSLQKEVWRVEQDTPSASGVLATAGGLVFQGSTRGSLHAYHADTGKELWSTDTQASVTAAPITYETSGQQFVAVVVGSGGAIALEGGQRAATTTRLGGTPRILVYSLAGKATLPTTSIAADVPLPPKPFGKPDQLLKGKSLYARYCARCHGENVINAGLLKDLRQSTLLADTAQWKLTVYAGLLTSKGMVGFMAELSPADAESIRAFVVGRANEIAAAQK